MTSNPRRLPLRVLVMPIKANLLPVDTRTSLAIRLDELVEEFGREAVALAMAQIEAANQETH